MKQILTILSLSITLSIFAQSSGKELTATTVFEHNFDQEFIATINGTYQCYLTHEEALKIDKIEILNPVGDYEIIGFDIFYFGGNFHNKTKYFCDSLITLIRNHEYGFFFFYNLNIKINNDTIILNEIYLRISQFIDLYEIKNIRLTNKRVGISKKGSFNYLSKAAIRSQDSLIIYNNKSSIIQSYTFTSLSGHDYSLDIKLGSRISSMVLHHISFFQKKDRFIYHNIIGTNEKGEEILFPPFIIFIE